MGSHEIENAWFRSGFGHEGMVIARLQQPRHFTVGILEISEEHASRRADGHTGRIKSLLDTVDAERALIGIAVGMDEPRVVGTRGNTSLAANTHVVLDEYDAAKVMNVTRTGGATIDAGWIAAMITPLRSDLHVKRWIFSLDLIFNPISIQPFRNIVLGLARHNAIHAANALRSIDNHPESSHGWPPIRWSRS
jgi:hypothetical protein